MAKKKTPDTRIEDAEIVESPETETTDAGDSKAPDPTQDVPGDTSAKAVSPDAPEDSAKSEDVATPDDDYEFADPIIDMPQAEPEAPAEDEHHTSLSARILQGLALIAVGVALALWGAPKLAPMLPAGLAPVAEFLMPGQTEAKAEIAALRAELDTRITAVESRPTSNLDKGAIDTAIAGVNQALQAELAAIRDQLAATDGQDIEARLAALETRMEGVAAELTAVSDRLSRQITENGVALSEEAATKLSGYQAALEGLRAEVKALAARNGALSQKVEEIANAAARRVQAAEVEASTRVATTATRKLLTEIDAALDTGAPFSAALAGLQDVSGATPPDALAAVADSGTASWTTLRNRFADQAHAALRADATANAGDGVGSRLGAFLRSQIGTRSLERRDGTDADAILSRVEDDLVNRRLSAALSEAESLPEAARAAMADWIADLRALTQARTALDDLTVQLGATE